MMTGDAAMKNLFSGYILAGGKSSRMGTDKAFLRFGELTFAERAAAVLRPRCLSAAIVLNPEQTNFVEKLPGGVSYIFDSFPNRGALGGIHAALQNCPTDFAVILAVDLPRVSGEAIEKLQHSALKNPDYAAIVPTQIDGRRQPLCAVYRADRCLGALERTIRANESLSVGEFLKSVKTLAISEEELRTDAGEDLFYNVNDRRDFQRLNDQKLIENSDLNGFYHRR